MSTSFSAPQKHDSKIQQINSKLNRFYQKQKDQITYFLSKSFGNSIGSITFQRFVKSINIQELKRIKQNLLQPGDLILKKSSGAFSDKLIPGHFNHIALYLGSYNQLKTLTLSNGEKLIDQKITQKHLPKIFMDKTIIDPIRSGIVLSDLKKWRVNDLAIIRLNNYSSAKLSDSLLKAIKYLGTKYDFNFDIDTKHTIFCSELPYQIFEDVKFKISKNVVRWTINPDDIAILAGKQGQKNKPFSLIYLNHNTKVIDLDKNFRVYKKILKH